MAAAKKNDPNKGWKSYSDVMDVFDQLVDKIDALDARTLSPSFVDDMRRYVENIMLPAIDALEKNMKYEKLPPTAKAKQWGF